MKNWENESGFSLKSLPFFQTPCVRNEAVERKVQFFNEIHERFMKEKMQFSISREVPIMLVARTPEAYQQLESATEYFGSLAFNAVTYHKEMELEDALNTYPGIVKDRQEISILHGFTVCRVNFIFQYFRHVSVMLCFWNV